MKLHIKVVIGKQIVRNDVVEPDCLVIASARCGDPHVDHGTLDQTLKVPIEAVYFFPDAEENDCEGIPEKHLCLVVYGKDRRKRQDSSIDRPIWK